MAPNTASLTRRLWLWLVPAVYPPPAYHPTGPWTWPRNKGNARRHQVTGRRERCGNPLTEMPPKEKGAPRKRYRAFQGPGGPIRRRSCPGFFRGILSSEALAGDLKRRFPEDAFVKFGYALHSVTRKALETRRLCIHKAVTHGFTS
jgi:hypothetical protein